MSKQKTDSLAAIGSLMNNAKKIHGQDAQPSPAAAVAVAEPNPASRSFTFIMKSVDIAKMDAVILATHQTNGLRLSIADVMRIALQRLPAAPVSREEVAALRARDSRRRVSAQYK